MNEEKNTQNSESPHDSFVTYDVKGAITSFDPFDGDKINQQIVDCTMLISVTDGVFSVSTKNTNGMVVSLRFDEVLQIITHALQIEKERVQKTEESKNGD